MNKWQKPSNVMSKIISRIFNEYYGFTPEYFVVHSYKDVGTNVIVNFEVMYDGKLYIGTTKIED